MRSCLVSPIIKVCALLTALACIHNTVKFLSGSFILEVIQFLSQCFAGSEVNWDVMLRENSSKLL